MQNQPSQAILDILFAAVRSGEIGFVENTLRRGVCSSTIVDKEGYSLLHYAALKQNLQMVKTLMSFGCNINATCPIGHTPLHLAVIAGANDIIWHLLKSGSNVNAASARGNTPLHYAVGFQRLEAAKILLQERANVNQADRTRNPGPTPICYAACNLDIPMTDLLLQYGANINYVDEMSLGVLHYALNGPPEGNYELSPNIRKKTANMPDLLPYVQFLNSKNINLNQCDSSGSNCLVGASSSGHVDVAFYLLEQGVNPNSVDHMNQTVLHHAAYFGRPEIVKAALDRGCDITILNKMNKSALHSCATGGDARCLELLLEAAQGNLELINGLDSVKSTPLHYACRRGNETTVEMLLKAGADVNSTSYYGCTPAVVTCIIEWIDLESPNSPEKLTAQHSHFVDHHDIPKDESDEPLDTDFDDPKPWPVDWENLEDARIQQEFLSKVMGRISAMDETSRLLTRAMIASYQYGDVPTDPTLNEEEDKNSLKKAQELRFAEILAIAKDPYYPEEYATLVANASLEYILTSPHTSNVRFRKLDALDAKKARILRKLVEYGADLTISHPDKEGLVGLAALHCLYEVAKVLLENNAPVNVRGMRSERMFSPLGYACFHNNHRMISLLLDNGARLCKTDKMWSQTTINLPFPSLIKRMIDNGDYNVNFPFAWNGVLKINKEFLLPGVGRETADPNIRMIQSHISPLMRHVRDENLSVVQLLLDNGADPRFRTNFGTTVFHDAVIHQDEEILRLLISTCSDIINLQDLRGYTPLHIAAQEHNDYLAEILIEAGADVKILCNLGRTPLHFAALTAHGAQLECFYDYCPEHINALDKYQATPLHYCVSRANDELLEDALRYLMTIPGINPHQKDIWGLSPIDIAVKKGKHSILPLLTAQKRMN